MYARRTSLAAALSAVVLLCAADMPVRGAAQVDMESHVHLVLRPGDDAAAYGFEPQSLTVPPGTVVLWLNTTNAYHTVTFAESASKRVPSGVFDRPLSAPGDSVQFRFDRPGRYAYYCQPHSEFMFATVRVTGDAGDGRRWLPALIGAGAILGLAALGLGWWRRLRLSRRAH